MEVVNCGLDGIKAIVQVVIRGLNGINATVYHLIFPSLHHYDLLDMAILCHCLVQDWQIGGSTTMFSCLHFNVSLMRDLVQMECDSLKTAPVERRITSMLSSNTRFPSEFHPSMQIVLFDSMSRETRPRMQLIPPRDLYPRVPGLQRNALNIQSREDLAKLEQEKTLKMLKKVIYSSGPKNLTRRLSQYYNSGAGSSNATIRANSEELDEDSKRCAICLDDFEPGTEVICFMKTVYYPG